MYDYVIVGGGTAGCVLANRLSAEPGARVLLLEAGGPDRRREIQIPAAFSKLFWTPLDWNYRTEPQAAVNGRELYWPRGKVLGGCSSMNAMIYVRGNPLDYDGWRDAGCAGWGYADVLPLFRRAENQARGASQYHGVGGALDVSDLRCVNPLSRAFVAAGAELGLARNPDFNAAEQDGVGFYQVNQRNGRRQSAAGAYLRPILYRSNLAVRTGAQATRLVFDGTRAVGVEYVRKGKTQRALAAREVLLCAGAINSPQLLLLSGVGPAEALGALGVPVVADLPGVGENLQDHLAVPVIYDCTRPVSLDGAETLANLARFLFFQRGPLTSNVAEAGAFVRTRPGLPAPDLQFHFAPGYYRDHGAVRRAGHSFTFGPTLLTPRSRGRITLRSTDPFEAPAIDPRYLTEEADLRVLVEGVKLSRELAAAKAFDGYRGGELHPGPAVRTDAELADHVRRTVETLYHPAGTCRMGEDERSVVDSRLRVRGVEGVRVADASVMPTIVRGNTNAPAVMIAERAADLIRGGARWWFPLLDEEGVPSEASRPGS